MLATMWGNRSSHLLVVGMQSFFGMLEISYKAQHNLPI